MNTLNRFTLSFVLLLLSVQTLATLSPDPVTKKFHIKNDVLQLVTLEPMKVTFFLENSSMNTLGGILENTLTRCDSEPDVPSKGSVGEYTHHFDNCTKAVYRFLTLEKKVSPGDLVSITGLGAGNLRDYILCVDDFCGPFAIASRNALNVVEGTNLVHTLIVTDINATLSIVENPNNLFSLSGTNNTTLNFNGKDTDYESDIRTYTVKIKATIGDGDDKNTEQTITVTIGDNEIAFFDQARTVNENAAVDTNVGEVLVTSGTVTNFHIIGGNNEGFFKVNSAGQIQVNKSGLDYETTQSYTLEVRITGANTENETAQITITIGDIDDTAPTNITLSSNYISIGLPAGTLIGTLSATDIDTNTDNDALIYSVNSDNFQITDNKLQTKKVLNENKTFSVEITVKDKANNTARKTFTIVVNSDPAIITNTDISVKENMTGTVLTINATDASIPAPILTYSISGTDQGKFNLNNNILTFKNSPNYEEQSTYSLILEVYDTISTTKKPITITITTEDKPLVIKDQSMNVDEKSDENTTVGTVTIDDGIVTGYSIKSGSDGFFKINSEGKIQVAKTGLDYETKSSYILTVEITGDNVESKTAKITIAINDVYDAPIAIFLTRNSIAIGAAIGEIVGTLSASNIGDNNLTYEVNDTVNFEIVGNKLKIKVVTDTQTTYPIRISVSNGIRSSQEQGFSIAVISAPVISQFTVTQNGNKGRLISKNGGNVTIEALAGVGTYAWSSDFSDMDNNADNSTFVFNPVAGNIGIQSITLEVTANGYASERVLKLQLVEENISSDDSDSDGDGIPNSKDINTESNKIQAGTGKTITSLENTRILLGVMGKDSGRLTFGQMKGYMEDNHMADITKDTSSTGDIYDYVIESLNATGISAKVIIELATPLPKDAELRKYSLVTNSWSGFVVNANNVIASKKSATCIDNVVWQTMLIQGATCLKLTIKDGGVNDTDGDQSNTGQANGVIESTIAIATPVTNNDSTSANSNSGGCVYNPNAPARFDIGFVLLMMLSTYYFIRRKRRFIR
ncbi:hypothetical protein MS2017_1659 [Bathymodiolus thermophilus thioautotrophic gill symbiont]|uniref:Cadherin domain-containing protein n=2 Tax=Bathymodiolus thermophilus thioautotrophic gill symbiont TaxID=2360 RepID=A0A3G3INS1_9GAMM|nr:cadherin repeat domain-containing protein [Bathymodiolus thermophilus thioautotrophic gill symbiont]AYQ57339.1 hypothetical protein MS2017_1659 [Bathymodiolus thermophilus thioautotrophic gill symbiont]